MRFISTLILSMLILSCQKRKAEVVATATADTPTTPTATLTQTIAITPAHSPTPTLRLEIGDIAYDLNLADKDSIPVSLASLRGKLVLIQKESCLL